ncbi:unnamed protein product [Lactuca virosa]|uniref:Uncharacterized protein n=1 Tax=Lactuca virosa TaxID=75947 RepID=A0AAU9PRL3_9ASTR|nr:unnamed protein product [Lactuca virosa]
MPLSIVAWVGPQQSAHIHAKCPHISEAANKIGGTSSGYDAESCTGSKRQRLHADPTKKTHCTCTGVYIMIEKDVDYMVHFFNSLR